MASGNHLNNFGSGVRAYCKCITRVVVFSQGSVHATQSAQYNVNMKCVVHSVQTCQTITPPRKLPLVRFRNSRPIGRGGTALALSHLGPISAFPP